VRHRWRERLGIVADVAGIAGFILFLLGAVGKQLEEFFAKLQLSNVTLIVVGAVLIAVDIVVRLYRQTASRETGPSTHPPPTLLPEIPMAPAPAALPASAPVPVLAASPAPASASDRIIVDRTPEQLTASFKGVTGVQARDRIARYLGNWMRVSGTVSDVSMVTAELVSVRFAERSIMTYNDVVMYFRGKKWIDRLVLMNQGDKLSVIGKIDKVSPVSLDLEYCEIEG
jgi:hypothetical protein